MTPRLNTLKGNPAQRGRRMAQMTRFFCCHPEVEWPPMVWREAGIAPPFGLQRDNGDSYMYLLTLLLKLVIRGALIFR